jgi:DNA-directed RNA polymerase beta' subunit
MRNKYLDWTQANSDSVIEVYRRFGIEAARQKIIQEMRNIVECSNRHYLIYADVMTSTGYPTSINRGGQGLREIDNPLLRIGTAAPINVMAEAAIVGAVDKVSGVTGPLLLGSTPRIGTSYNALVVNEARVIQHLKTAEQYLDEI